MPKDEASVGWSAKEAHLEGMDMEDIMSVSLDSLDPDTRRFVELFRGHYNRHGNEEFARRLALNRLRQERQTVNRRIVLPLPCPRCSGDGIIQEFAHIEGGVCYMCGGEGTTYLKLSVFTDDAKDEQHLQEQVGRAVQAIVNRDRIEVATKEDLEATDLIVHADFSNLLLLAERFRPMRHPGVKPTKQQRRRRFSRG